MPERRSSLAFVRNVPISIVQRILRHSKVQVTRTHYIKVRDAKVDAAMAKLD